VAAAVVRGAGLNARPAVVAPALAAATASKVAAAPAKGVEGRPLSRLRSEPCSCARVREAKREREPRGVGLREGESQGEGLFTCPGVGDRERESQGEWE
jgi:hypothetical protein